MRLRLLALSLLAAAPLSAQVPGLPVVNNGVPTGLVLSADAGFANADAGKGTTLGASGTLGIGLLGITGTIAHVSPKVGDGFWAPGLAGTLRLLGGPLIPIRVTAQAGVSRWSVGDVDFTHVPVSLGIAATIPSPGFSIKPWIAPRLDYAKVEANGSDSETHFGISGGVELSLLNGLSLHAAYDRLFAGSGVKPSVFSVGVGFAP